MSGEYQAATSDISIKPEMEANDSAYGGLPRQHKRRPHTKSRNGCTTCKRRRVKCDETRPICRNCQHLRLECRYVSPASLSCADLQIMNLKLLHHYDQVVAKTIADAGISTHEIWSKDVVEMGFKYPFLMHAVLMFSATHLAQREPKEYCNAVVQHRSEALTLLRNEVQRINSENLDPLVATSVLLILDAMANAALPSRMTPSSLPASTWLHHVRGAATILLAVGVLPPTSKFYSFLGVDLLDLANCYARADSTDQGPGQSGYSSLQCFMPELTELYPVPFDSPYFSSLVFLDKLHSQRGCADFILRVFSFPALMDKEFVRLLASGDKWAKLIVSSYYRLVRQYVKEMHDQVWFLNGVSTVLPIDMDNEFGGLGFVTDALPVSQNVDSILAKFDASFAAAENRIGMLQRHNPAAQGNISGNTSNGPQMGGQQQMSQQQQQHQPPSATNTNSFGSDFLTNAVFDDIPNDSRSNISDSYGPTASGFTSGQSSADTSPPTAPPSAASTAPPTASNSLAASPSGNTPLSGMQQQNGLGMQHLPQGTRPLGSASSLRAPGYDGGVGQSHLSEVLPHTYGRIHKQMSNQSSVMPGIGSRVPPRSRPISRNNNSTRSMGGRSRNIIRPGMMGLPVDPSIADDLLSGLEFGDVDYSSDNSNSNSTSGENDPNFGFRDIVFDTDTLEWKPPAQQQQFGIATNTNNPYMGQRQPTRNMPPMNSTQQPQQQPPQQPQQQQQHQLPAPQHQSQPSQPTSQQAQQPMQSMQNGDIFDDPFGGSGPSMDNMNPIKQEIMDNDFQSVIDLDDDLAIVDNYDWNASRA